MMSNLPPGSLILLGAFLVPLMRGRIGQVWTVLMPVLSFAHLLFAHSSEQTVTATIFGQELTPIRVDKLSLVWGYVFHIAAILAAIYALRVRDRIQHFASMMYVGASIGAVFAGDLLTLFIYWEMTAISSVFLVWAGKSTRSIAAGMRYVIMHVGSGVLVLSGALLLLVDRGTLSFGAPGELGMFHELGSSGACLLLIGFGIKAAFPLLHCWLPDSYPKSTATGTVFLSAFTTKMAIYALARGFAGCHGLIMVGVIMAIFPLVYALLADDMRQTLAHVLNNQLGFMVVGIGVGTEMAINGVAAQAFAHVIYKGLLFMALGAVLDQVGTTKQTQLGGLSKWMPWTCAFCLVGALSVVPLNCGFVTKALVLSAVAEEHWDFVWLGLVAGAVGAFLTAGIKVPYFTFFGEAKKYPDPVEEAPANMLVAMGASATLCLLIGVLPGLLYDRLPFECNYHAYTVSHVVQQLQLLCFTTLAFVAAQRFGFYPRPVGALLDFDWLYRRPTPYVVRWFQSATQRDILAEAVQQTTKHYHWMAELCSEAGLLGRSVSTNAMAISAAILLAIYLLIYY